MADPEAYYNGIIEKAKLAVERPDVKVIYRAISISAENPLHPRALFQRKLIVFPTHQRRRLW